MREDVRQMCGYCLPFESGAVASCWGCCPFHFTIIEEGSGGSIVTCVISESGPRTDRGIPSELSGRPSLTGSCRVSSSSRALAVALEQLLQGERAAAQILLLDLDRLAFRV